MREGYSALASTPAADKPKRSSKKALVFRPVFFGRNHGRAVGLRLSSLCVGRWFMGSFAVNTLGNVYRKNGYRIRCNA
jgi:hypothetical protein